MKESAILQNLEEIAEQLNIKVCSVNLKQYSHCIKSGLCRVRGEYRVIVDKHLNLSEKIDVLIEALQEFDATALSIHPKIRKLIVKKGVKQKELILQ